MSSEQFQRAKRVFLEASQRLRDERASFLDEACGGEVPLRKEVEALLVFHDREDSALEAPHFRGVSEQPVCPTPRPEQIGEFRILDLLGEGGMGVVYLAEQEKPRRTVALKVIRPGIATPSTLRRFQNEADVLARVRHSGIAQIYEAGTADTGYGSQPYFAMEPVDGVPITEFVAKAQLGTRERLRLLCNVCDAVQHAHQKGVIHRDLKPSNILVDSSGQPKIVDFGVARATDSDVQATTHHTNVGELIGTLSYMSPEQIAGDPNELDTRTDVYALGVICYELLAGRLPHDVKNRAIPEAIRLIREVDPTPLSSINKAFRGDVETIVSKALEKQTSRRYQSASDLATDIERYLRNEPITARPASATYQIRKFAQRHRALVGALTAAFLALAFGMIAATWQAARAMEAERRFQQEAETSKQIMEFLVKLFEVSDPGESVGSTVTAREILDKCAKTIEKELNDQPQVQAALMNTIARVYTNLGLYASAQKLLESALAIRRRQLPNGLPDVAQTLNNLAAVFALQGKMSEAELLYRQLMETTLRVMGPEHPNTLRCVGNVANVLCRQNKLADAEPMMRNVLERRQRTLGPKHPDTLSGMNNLAVLLTDAGKLSEAESLHRQTLEIRRTVHENDHPKTLMSMSNLAYVLQLQGKLSEAESVYRQALEAERFVLTDNHRLTLGSMNNLAFLLIERGKLSEAEPLCRQALETRRRVLGKEHPHVFFSMRTLAKLLHKQGKTDEAERMYRQTLDSRRRALRDEHPDTLTSMNDLADFLTEQGNLSEAESLFAEVMQFAPAALRPEHWQAAVMLSSYGACLTKLGRYDEAQTRLVEGYQRLKSTLGDNHPRTREAFERLITLYDTWNRPQKTAEYRALLPRPDRGLEAPTP